MRHISDRNFARQMYCHNQLLNHPLVSPVNAGSLGGLPPLYIVSAILSLCFMSTFLTVYQSSQCCGGSELLRDEIMVRLTFRRSSATITND